MLDLKGNLKWAENAVKYTKQQMIQETLGGWIGNKICTQFSRLFAQANNERSMCDFIRSWSNRALRAGCGNCAEQAAIAFMYLVHRGIVPIDYMGFVDNVDHAFVVIGREHNSIVNNIKSWGQFAVVCDPYEKRYYRVLPVNQSQPLHKYLKKGKVTCICSKKDSKSQLKSMNVSRGKQI